jgi:hypothetical protein
VSCVLVQHHEQHSRQVAEAITINYTADQILNSKNDYMANYLEEERFDK